MTMIWYQCPYFWFHFGQ